MNPTLETFYKDHQVKLFMTTFQKRNWQSWIQIDSKGGADTETMQGYYRPSSKEESLIK